MSDPAAESPQDVSTLRSKWEQLSNPDGSSRNSEHITGPAGTHTPFLTVPMRKRNLSSSSVTNGQPGSSTVISEHPGVRTRAKSAISENPHVFPHVGQPDIYQNPTHASTKKRPPPPPPLRKKPSSESGKRSDVLASFSGSQVDGVLVNLDDETEKNEPPPSVRALREMFGNGNTTSPSSAINIPPINRTMSPTPMLEGTTSSHSTSPMIKLSTSASVLETPTPNGPPALPPRSNILSRSPSRPALALDTSSKSHSSTQRHPPPPPPPLSTKSSSRGHSPSLSSTNKMTQSPIDSEGSDSGSDGSPKTPLVSGASTNAPPPPPRLPTRRQQTRSVSVGDAVNLPPPVRTNQPPPIPVATRPTPASAAASTSSLTDTLSSLSGSNAYSRSAASTSSLLSSVNGSVIALPVSVKPKSTSTPSSNTIPLPPPPTRSIPLGAIPPPRRKDSGTTSESDDELDKKTPLSSGIARRDAFPDASHSSRRLPLLPHPYKSLTLPTSSSSTSVSPSALCRAKGPLLVFGGMHAHHGVHTIRWYDLKEEVWREGDTGERKITALEWASGESESASDEQLIWAGTKDGALLLLGLTTSSTSSLTDDLRIVDLRAGWHANPITHLIRSGDKMLSIDDGGKCVLFPSRSSSSSDSTIKPLASFRHPLGAAGSAGIAWAFIVKNKVWVSSGNGLKIYNLDDPAGRPFSLTPSSSAVGTMVCGTTMPSRPGRVYTGHEGGVICTWSCPVGREGSEDKAPGFVGATKVGVSDVLCLVGVNDRLWSAGRKGNISIFSLPPTGDSSKLRHGKETKNDTSKTSERDEEECHGELWKVTNEFIAHLDAPVLSLVVDPFSIEKMGRLAIVSIGRDEQVKFWDGLLGTEWIESKLAMHEKNYSSFRPLNVLICTWNVDAARPDALSSGGPENLEFLDDCLRSVDKPDIICFGFQEMIDLNDRKLTAKTVLLGRKKKDENGASNLSEKVTRAYKQWHDRLVLAVRLAMPPDDPYVVLHTESLVGLFTCIFVRRGERGSMASAHVSTIKRGMKGLYGNKGAIVARVVIDDSSISFINCHLAAGQHHKTERNKDVAAILEEKQALPAVASIESKEALAYVGGGDGSMVLDHELCFLNGDLNYRVDYRREAVIQSISNGDHANLLQHDQLLKEIAQNPGFRLCSFREAPITFAPTYKYDPFTSNYDSSEKKRIPAWCDRILYKCRDPTQVQALNYRRYEVNVSDHRPVSAGFRVTVKRIDHEARNKVKLTVGDEWQLEEHFLLSKSRDWFRELGLLA